jgi:CRISPR-associated protein Csb2
VPTLLFRFPGGRYHATPTGHHVNEGLIEWPPSPWRILRALIACGFTTQRWSEVPPEGRELFETLASVLPSYWLPPASVAHSRHYMPIGILDKGREKTTLVFDSWADVGRGTLAVRWSCELARPAEDLLGALAAHLGYLGRSESWVTAELADDDREMSGETAYPHADDELAKPGWEQVARLVPEPPAVFAVWRERIVEKVLAPFPLPAGKKKPGKKLLKDRAAAVEPYPDDLLDCLQRDTSWWKKHRWSQPPGSRRVLYWRPADALTVAPPVRSSPRSPARSSTMLLALSTPSGSRSALPSRERALPQAELIHRSLVAQAGKGERVNCPELTGKDANGRPLTGHRHAHILPVDLDNDGRLDHVVIHAPMGLGSHAQSAVRRLKRTWTKGGVGDLQLALAGQGELDDLRTLPAPLDVGVEALLGPVGGARTWVSLTPLVLPRHLKPRGKNAFEGQVIAELASRGMPPATVELLGLNDETRKLRHAVRARRHPARPPPQDTGFAVRLIFDRAVRGPIALGYASHYGLGLFSADTG